MTFIRVRQTLIDSQIHTRIFRIKKKKKTSSTFNQRYWLSGDVERWYCTVTTLLNPIMLASKKPEEKQTWQMRSGSKVTTIKREEM